MDSRLKEDIQRLAKTRPTVGALAASAKANPVAPVTSTGAVRAAASTGGGIASPLTEPDAATRTWHSAITYNSTDGLWSFQMSHPHTIDFLDDNDQEVQFIYDAP
jgi:hypothetical protein